MSVLVIGDIHIKIDNLDDIGRLIDRVVVQIERLNPLAVILLGDILDRHERIHTICMQYAERLFEACSDRVPTFVLVGNHDYISNSQFLTTAHWMTPFKKWNGLTIVDHVVEWKPVDRRILLCPYVPDSRMVEALSTVPDWQSADLIFGHQTLNGVKMGAIRVENTEEWLPEYPLLISGHIHERQRLAPNLYYTGTPMQQAWGESIHKTICVVDLTTKVDRTFPLTEIELNVHRRRMETISIEQAKVYDKKVAEHESLRLTIRGLPSEIKVFKKTKAYTYLCSMATIVFDETEYEKVEIAHLEQKTFDAVLFERIQADHFMVQLYKKYKGVHDSATITFLD
jgi:DNA repair exonuclease SbcCD nuclease subunit